MFRSLAAILGCALLVGCAPTESSQPKSRDERVREHFGRVGVAVAEKESLSSPPALGYVMVDEERLDDGTVRSVWATTAEGVRSRCFYVDVERPGGGAHGYGGCGGGDKKQVTLSGNDTLLVGGVGTWPAAHARIMAGGREAVVPVRQRLFLVPDRLTLGEGTDYTIVLLDEGGSVIAEVKDVRLAGT